jgi:hypothetical protein
MNKLISPGELHVGQFVTVFAWEPYEAFSGGLAGDFNLPLVATHVDHSWEGSVLEIVAVNLPYIAVKNRSDTYLKHAFDLDTRRVSLMELSPEYILAMKRDGTP